ncbi:MAG: polysaccharide biosynthesis/export family protein [Bacteroidales bacterium]|nr:polysaccharide biosynthesis/export family protein [Bacteroidales bacterium]
MKSTTLFIISLFIIATSCTSYKKVPYLQGAENLTKEDLSIINAKYSQKIMPSDMLSITVNSTTPESAIPFNLPLIPTSKIETNGYGLNSSFGIQSYLVDSEGKIEFPILGAINIGGLSKNEVQDLIKSKIYPDYIKEEPIVTVRFVNYKVSLLGEVARPGTYSVVNDKINILEALSLAGDMTIYGRRDNIMLMRENEKGEKEIIRIDLTKNDILKSPYFYIQQNDIIYVQPNKSRARGADIGSAETLLISVVGTLISLTSLIITVLK